MIEERGCSARISSRYCGSTIEAKTSGSMPGADLRARALQRRRDDRLELRLRRRRADQARDDGTHRRIRVRHRGDAHPILLVEQIDDGPIGHRRHDDVEDALHRRLQAERLRERFTGARGELQLLVQPRVLDRVRGARGERLGDAHVGAGQGPSRPARDELQDPVDARAPDERDGGDRTDVEPPQLLEMRGIARRALHRVVVDVRDHVRLPGARDVGGGASLAHRIPAQIVLGEQRLRGILVRDRGEAAASRRAAAERPRRNRRSPGPPIGPARAASCRRRARRRARRSRRRGSACAPPPAGGRRCRCTSRATAPAAPPRR